VCYAVVAARKRMAGERLDLRLARQGFGRNTSAHNISARNRVAASHERRSAALPALTRAVLPRIPRSMLRSAGFCLYHGGEWAGWRTQPGGRLSLCDAARV